MKSVLALSALLFARAVFAQDSLSASTTPSASATDSVVSATAADNSSIASTTGTASITGSASSTSATGSAKKSKTSSTAAAAATGASYSIPSGISSSCSKFLAALDTDSTLGNCTAPLLKATSNFSGSSSSQSQSSVTSTLNALCSVTGCSDKYIRTQLTNFASACKAELDPSTGNKSVRDTYDILYIMQPWQDAICQKDDDGTWCALNAPSNDATNSTSTDKTGAVNNAVVSSESDLESDADLVHAAIEQFNHSGSSLSGSLKFRKRASQTVVDTATYRSSGVMYLYTLPSLSVTSLCTTCTQKILESYTKWELALPYAAGLSNSPMLGDQATLWSQVKSKCGTTFMNTVTSAMGTANAEKNSGTQIGVSSTVAGALAVAMGFFVAL